MKFPSTSGLVKLNALIGFAALVLCVVAFASTYWLEQNFDFPVNAGGIATIPVHASIGLFTACRTEYYPNNKSSEACSPDGAAEWQFISAGLSIVGLVSGLVGVVLSVLGTVLEKVANRLKVKLAIVLFYFVSCGFSVATLIIFSINRRIQVRPNQSTFQVDFDLAWAYVVSAASVGLFAIVLLLHTLDIIWYHYQDEYLGLKKKDREELSKDVNGTL